MVKSSLVRYAADGKVYAARVRTIGIGSYYARFANGECLFARRAGGEFFSQPMASSLSVLCTEALTECPRSPSRFASPRTLRRAAGSSSTPRAPSPA
jgi:hypothetical protein